MDSVVAHILHLPFWLALTVVFALPALEASVFLGVIVPGEVALVLGGVLASAHKAPLWAVIIVGVLGAIVGDSIGYAVGHRWGHRVLATRPAQRIVKPEHVERGSEWLVARGGRAVFLGRFTAALRALMPGLAGMAGVRYRVFLPWNVLGGSLWGTAAVLLGYAAGTAWQKAAHYASLFGFGILALVAIGVGIGVVRRRRGHPQGE